MSSNNWVSLKHKILAEPPSYSFEEKSILDLVYEAYCECHGYDSEEIMSCYHNLCELLAHLSYKEREQILNSTSLLCKEYERNGFIEGIRIGIRLDTEINKS